MININYQKRKNNDLFKSLECDNTLSLSKTQNYIPIYRRFFNLNDNNYNNINLNNLWYLYKVNENACTLNENILNCKIKNINTQKTKETDVFFKLAPLIDPLKYIVGKYENNNNIFNLPSVNSTEHETEQKYIDYNNSAYVDSFFVYLSSKTLNEFNFFHGVNFYGSFLAIKNNFNYNAIDDIDYLIQSNFFNENKDILFKIDNYEELFEKEKLPPINIGNNISRCSVLSAISIQNVSSFDDSIKKIEYEKTISLDDIKNNNIDLVDLTDYSLDFIKNCLKTKDNNINNIDDNYNTNHYEKKSNATHKTINSSSTFSSRTSHTSIDNKDNFDDNKNNYLKIDNLDIKCENNDNEHNENDENDENDENTEINNDEDSATIYETDTSSYISEDRINVSIKKMPVQVICMENCEDTFDNLIINTEMSDEEWLSALMQVIMILITYQKIFAFTHNDLHTNNIMYNKTNRKHIYYLYNNKYYKVPTFGRIFKIIDFGRSIYRFDNKIFCSDSFKKGGDAESQYNTEPYFNDAKPRLEPNFSFDLCRLGCSIFDFIVDDISATKELDKLENYKRIIVEWCLDDNGVNILYKNNGNERYPDFKLYKMIARCIHNHTPQAQLERPEFNKYSEFVGNIPNDFINIDSMPVLK